MELIEFWLEQASHEDVQVEVKEAYETLLKPLYEQLEDIKQPDNFVTTEQLQLLLSDLPLRRGGEQTSRRVSEQMPQTGSSQIAASSNPARKAGLSLLDAI